MKSLLSTAYWPNLHYFYYVLQQEEVLIEQFEHYPKQSYRNRCTILSANGPLDLNIPVSKNAPKTFTKDVTISYSENWQNNHWRAIVSAYKNSPYFDYFEQEVAQFYERRYTTLLEFNTEQLQTLLKILRVKKEISYTATYDAAPQNSLDLREKIHPKIAFGSDDHAVPVLSKSYYQTFGNKFEFVPNLSMLDLVFNTGLEALGYLEKLPES